MLVPVVTPRPHSLHHCLPWLGAMGESARYSPPSRQSMFKHPKVQKQAAVQHIWSAAPSSRLVGSVDDAQLSTGAP